MAALPQALQDLHRGRSQLLHGALQRSAAATDDTLDVMRLALVDLVPVFKQVAAVAHGEAPTPQTPLPGPSRAALHRLSLSLARRVTADSLSPLARAYHCDAVAALQALADAAALGDVLVPAQQLVRAWQGFVAHADAHLAVLQAPRPPQMALHTASTQLDEVSEALAQLALSEDNIAAVRRRQGTQGEVLQSFARLEIDLGHALDLIYASEESGLHIGLDLAQASLGMGQRLAAVHRRLGLLADWVQRFAQRPPTVGSDLHAEQLQGAAPGSQGGNGYAELHWSGLPGSRGISWVRLYRAVGDTPPQRLAEMPPGRGVYVDSALPQTVFQRSAAQLSPASQPGAGAAKPGVSVAPGQPVAGIAAAESSAATAQPAVPDAGSATLNYRLVAVSPFGVESKPTVRKAFALPAQLQPPQRIEARALAPAFDAKSFYRNVDAVCVTWDLSPSDFTDAAAKQSAIDRKLPVVSRYDIFLLRASEAKWVGHAAPGRHAFLHRPSVADLQQGVRYQVVALGASGVRSAAIHPDSPVVRLDLSRPLALARAGGVYLESPTAWERQQATRLGDSAALATARAQFGRRNAAQQQALTAAFWAAASPARKLKWYDSYLVMTTQEERLARSRDLADTLSARDLPWAQAELFLADNPSLQDEPEHYWELLDEATQQQALQATGVSFTGAMQQQALQAEPARLNPAVQQSPQAKTQQAAQPDTVAASASPRRAKVLTWWQSRDAEELAQQSAAWAQMRAQIRRERVFAWVQSLPRETRQEILWPQWRHLNAAEQEAWMQRGYEVLPGGLWPSLLAWVHWQELATPVKLAAMAEELSLRQQLAARVFYAVRPIDAALAFKLPQLLLFVCLALCSATLLTLLRPRRT